MDRCLREVHEPHGVASVVAELPPGKLGSDSGYPYAISEDRQFMKLC